MVLLLIKGTKHSFAFKGSSYMNNQGYADSKTLKTLF